MNINELQKIEYIKLNDNKTLNNRAIPLMPYFIDDKWKLPFVSNGKVIIMKAKPYKSDYVSKNIINKETDIIFCFVNFLLKHASWQDIFHYSNCVTNDINSLFTSVTKIDMFFKYKDNEDDMSDLVSTEIEYILIKCKSMFDMLQKIIHKIWNKIQFKNKNIIKKNMPETFSKVIINNNKILSKDEIKEKLNIPDQLAIYYYNISDFYYNLKTLRDEIIHHGKKNDTIFVLKEGFAIHKESVLFDKYNKIWNNEFVINNFLYSIRPLIYYLIITSLKAVDDFCLCISNIARFPEDIIPDYFIYTRCVNYKSIINMKNELIESPWWPSG